MERPDRAFRTQADFCEKQGAELYAQLLRCAAHSLQADGAVATAVGNWAGDHLREGLPLRFMGAIHERVVRGLEPDLAAFYPTAGGTPGPGADAAFIDVVERNPEYIRLRLDRQVQTNEPRRSSALLGGYLTVAAMFGLRLNMTELGASAGLNLAFDHYFYNLGGSTTWGDASSSVRLRSRWSGNTPPLDAPLSVSARSGCDVSVLRLDDKDPSMAGPPRNGDHHTEGVLSCSLRYLEWLLSEVSRVGGSTPSGSLVGLSGTTRLLDGTYRP